MCTVGGFAGLGEALSDPVAIAVILGLAVGKPLGVMVSAWLVHTFTHAELDDDLGWVDVLGLSLLAGVGFTVSLLIGELAFAGTPRADPVIVAVLVGSLAAGGLATVVLRIRNKVYAEMCARDEADYDQDGVPDVYEPSDRYSLPEA